MGLCTEYSKSVLELPVYENKHYQHQEPYQFSDHFLPPLPIFRNLPAWLSTDKPPKCRVTHALVRLLTVIMLSISILSTFCFLRSALAAVAARPHDSRDAAVDKVGWDYDVIVVGGGPAGLSALSGLARVRRKAFLIDSGEYRNGETRVSKLCFVLALIRGPEPVGQSSSPTTL